MRRLREAGHAVVALVRDPGRAADLEALGVELAVGDITDRSTLAAPMEGADGVFHAAALYALGVDPARAAAVNVEGTRNVLETVRDVGVPKAVYTSTLAVNSDTRGERVDESYRHDGPHLSAYDATKWRAHFEVAEPLVEAGLPLVTVMPGVVYGPGDTSQVGDLLRRAAAGRRVPVPAPPAGACWAHVDDVAEGHLLAMEKGEPGEAYILAGPCHTFVEATAAAARAAGRAPETLAMPPAVLTILSHVVEVAESLVPVPGAYSSEALRVSAGTTYYGDNARARRELGWRPRSLEAGMEDTFGPGRPAARRPPSHPTTP